MKDWVKPYLIQQIEEHIGGDETFRKQWIENKVESFKSDQAVYWELVEDFNYHFGFGLGGEKDYFTTTFGAVLADLSQEVFLKLKEMRNLFFCFTPMPGAEVKQFRLEDDLRAGEVLQIVIFPYASAFMPPMAIRGEIAHELAHVWLEHRSTTEHEKQEDETDNLAREWGFVEEIEALRQYEEENWD